MAMDYFVSRAMAKAYNLLHSAAGDESVDVFRAALEELANAIESDSMPEMVRLEKAISNLAEASYEFGKRVGRNGDPEDCPSESRREDAARKEVAAALRAYATAARGLALSAAGDE